MTSRWLVDFTVPDDGMPLGPTTPLPRGHGGTDLVVTYVQRPLPYVIVGTADGVGASSPDSDARLDRRLEAIRRYVARRAGVHRSIAVPKVGWVRLDGRSGLYFQTRMAYATPTANRDGRAGAGWHPKVASSGLMALAVAMLHSESLPARIAGPLTTTITIATPAGPRSFEQTPTDEGTYRIRLFLGSVTTEEVEER